MYRKQGKNVVVRSHPCNDNRYGKKSKQALLKTDASYSASIKTERCYVPEKEYKNISI